VGNARLHRYVAAHLMGVLAEWAATIGVLVFAFEWGGSAKVGFVSIAVLAPPMLLATFAADVTARHRASSVRTAGFAVQLVAFTAAAITASVELPELVTVIAVVIGIGAVSTMRPSGAALLPLIARSTSDLVSGNLRTSYCESASAFFGPLVAAGLFELGGASTVFAGCAVTSLISLGATLWRPSPLALAPAVRVVAPSTGSKERMLRLAIAELRERRWAIGVLGVASARNVVIGAFDVMMVVLALQALDLGDGGSGRLWSLFGAGALVSTVVITVVARRSRLSATLFISLAIVAALCIAVGVFTEAPLVYAALPILGMGSSLMDNSSRMLLQRSTDPRRLGPLFALVGLVAGVGQIVGSLFAQTMLAVSGLETALVGLGALLFVMAVVTFRSLRAADSNADVPVVEMAVLGNLAMFAPLPPATLEMVARAADTVVVDDGTEIIRQGDEGDSFYAVVDGEFDIVMNGEFIRSAPQGDFFGEVALLSSAPRTATVRAKGRCEVLAIHRDPFLTAITGHETSRSLALDYIADMDIETKQRWTSEAARRRQEPPADG
jgi:hypothetical protein